MGCYITIPCGFLCHNRYDVYYYYKYKRPLSLTETIALLRFYRSFAKIPYNNLSQIYALCPANLNHFVRQSFAQGCGMRKEVIYPELNDRFTECNGEAAGKKTK